MPVQDVDDRAAGGRPWCGGQLRGDGSAPRCPLRPAISRSTARPAVAWSSERRAAPRASSSTCSRRTISGGREPQHVGRDGVDDEARLEQRGCHLAASGVGEHDAEQQAARPGPRRPAGGRGLDAVRRSRPDRVAWSSRPSRSIVSRTARAGGARDRVAAEGRAVLAGPSRLGRGAERDAARRSGRPPPRPLASVTTSGLTAASCLVREPVPVRPMPVCTSSSHSSAPAASAIRGPRPGSPAGGTIRRPRPGSARGRRPRCRRSTAARERVGVAVRDEGRRRRAAARTAPRLAGWPVSASAPMVRPWKAPSAATTPVRPVRRAILNAASLASAPELAEEHPAVGRAEQREQPLGERDLRLGRRRSSRRGRGWRPAGDRLDDRRVGVAERVDRDAGRAGRGTALPSASQT